MFHCYSETFINADKCLKVSYHTRKDLFPDMYLALPTLENSIFSCEDKVHTFHTHFIVLLVKLQLFFWFYIFLNNFASCDKSRFDFHNEIYHFTIFLFFFVVVVLLFHKSGHWIIRYIIFYFFNTLCASLIILSW